ncbi:hypothetical protein HYH03_000121 [Edaphochlamys debaryana]|uniref:Iron hydrogenase small subunit domain-containing protein n=1 Tax=Edaphochlamys debaryana TaxID=47281 RepID=A0A835YFI9_9CHLO|nr:hypothetical protein HYH03_000121 [Edaphochlamys debaryana]|eukprot:KAG2501616.1 hypothetical protein HYH03_000121 [Edaphochlamys debaryana]
MPRPVLAAPARPLSLTTVSLVRGDLACRTAEAAAEAKTAPEPHYQQALRELDTPRDSPNRKVVIASVAPAVRVAIAESFGLAPGTTTPQQLVEALKLLGFDHVYDTLFAADLTIMEEGTELIHRLKEQLAAHPGHLEPLPMFTSCCPGWVGMMEKSYPDLIPYVSSCKSPQMMMGTIVKSYLAEKKGLDPKDISMVSIMPCVRKQGEADRPWFTHAEGVRDVDHVITTAELGNILKERKINLPELPGAEFDNPLGEGSGGGVLFGTTGGVMEAALRTAYELVTGNKMERLSLSEVRGMDGIKEAAITLTPAEGSELAELLKRPGSEAPADAPKAGPIAWKADADGNSIKLRIAVANGLGNAKKLITKIQNGEASYDFIEIMACPAGCVGGGGQPRSTDKQAPAKRQAALYNLDEKSTIRRSHENPAIQQLYGEYLDAPNSHKAHDLLHTHYVPGGVENE